MTADVLGILNWLQWHADKQLSLPHGYAAEAAETIRTLSAERDEARASDARTSAEIERIATILGPRFLLDPPDGGDVKPHEGVQRIADALAALTAERDDLRAKFDRMDAVQHETLARAIRAEREVKSLRRILHCFNGARFQLGDRLRKVRGSEWVGRVVGWYSTDLTPIGYAIESEAHAGSVQIYPETALEPTE
jgi:hypothetical protein